MATGMRLELQLQPSIISFTMARDGGVLPWLLEVGMLRIQVRAGHLAGIGAGETPSLTVKLDNSGHKATKVIGRPLRARATVYDGDGSVFFEGVVASVAYSRVITLVLES